MTPSPPVASAVDTVLAETIEQHAAVLTSVDSEAAVLTDAIGAAARGGKRLRASFCAWGARGARPDLAPGVIQTAAALELFHLAALIHDDVMDDSDTRRGLATVHRSFADRHRRGRLRGNPDTHGTSIAILAGDLCLTWSDDLLAEALDDVDSDIRVRVRRMWSRMRDEAFAGQTLDMIAQTDAVTSRTRAQTILRYKSAKYTISHPLCLGGTLARADEDMLAAYDAIGIHAGEAFQLRDDVLGVFGDPSTTGKPVVDDIREGKRTLLVAVAEDRADAAGARLLARCLGNPAVTERDVADIREVMVATGALGWVEQRIDELGEQALHITGSLDTDPDTRQALSELIRQCLRRSA